jgi:hypothetical protein
MNNTRGKEEEEEEEEWGKGSEREKNWVRIFLPKH